MKRIYISTMHRLYEAGQAQGELGYVYVIDWQTKQRLDTIVVRPKSVPEGRSYGCRGVTIYNNVLYVATSDDTILKFHLDTHEQIGEIKDPSFKRLHQIKNYNEMLYVVSTGRDSLCILKDNKVVQVNELKERAHQLEQYVVQRTREDQWGNDMLHFNSIGWDKNGDEIHIYYNTRMVYNYTKAEIIHQGGLLHCPHDIAIVPDGFFVNSSANKASFFLKRNGDIFTVNKNLEVAPPDCPNNIGFMHGLAIGDGILFACSSPTKMQTFRTYEPFDHIETFHANNAINECIYDIALDPRDWSINNV